MHLDEIRYHRPAENILAWLTNCPALPDNIRFVLTSRPADALLNLFRTKQATRSASLQIAEEDAHVKQDIERFVTKLVGEPAGARAPRQRVVLKPLPRKRPTRHAVTWVILTPWRVGWTGRWPRRGHARGRLTRVAVAPWRRCSV